MLLWKGRLFENVWLLLVTYIGTVSVHYIYLLTFKVRVLLILCYVILMFIDLFIDGGIPLD